MGFDFVNTRMTGITGPDSVSSGSQSDSVLYQAINANIGNLLQLTPTAATASVSGTLIVRNGLIIDVLNLTSSNQSFLPY